VSSRRRDAARPIGCAGPDRTIDEHRRPRQLALSPESSSAAAPFAPLTSSRTCLHVTTGLSVARLAHLPFSESRALFRFRRRPDLGACAPGELRRPMTLRCWSAAFALARAPVSRPGSRPMALCRRPDPAGAAVSPRLPARRRSREPRQCRLGGYMLAAARRMRSCVSMLTTPLQTSVALPYRSLDRGLAECSSRCAPCQASWPCAATPYQYQRSSLAVRERWRDRCRSRHHEHSQLSWLNMSLPFAVMSGIGWRTSQCSTILPSSLNRKMSTTAVFQVLKCE